MWAHPLLLKQALVTRVFVEYINLMRKLQTTYWCDAKPVPCTCVSLPGLLGAPLPGLA